MIDAVGLLLIGCLASLGLGVFVGSMINIKITFKRGK